MIQLGRGDGGVSGPRATSERWMNLLRREGHSEGAFSHHSQVVIASLEWPSVCRRWLLSLQNLFPVLDPSLSRCLAKIDLLSNVSPGISIEENPGARTALVESLDRQESGLSAKESPELVEYALLELGFFLLGFATSTLWY